MAGKALGLLVVVGVVLGVAGLLYTWPVDATSHSAERSFNPDPVPPGGRLEVTITATGYGGIGQVIEELPAGFGYVESSLSESAVTGDGQTFTFILLGDETFTYIVTAPETEGRYTFSGIIKDFEKDERPVGGASDIRAGVAPPPPPTPSPTAVPTPTPVPTPYSDAHPDTHQGADGYADALTHSGHNPCACDCPDAHSDTRRGSRRLRRRPHPLRPQPLCLRLP